MFGNLLYYLVAFLVMIGVLIFVHEMGHYLVAVLCRVKVLRFSLGFGKVLCSWKRGVDQTEWVISAFPLGGYVKMLDEREGPVAAEEKHRSFNQQNVGKRIAIVAAGPLANMLLAVVLSWGIFVNGVDEIRPRLETPAQGSPAAQAGAKRSDLVLAVDGQNIQTWQELRWSLLEASVKKDSVRLKVARDHNQTALLTLDVSSARKQGWEADFVPQLGLQLFHPETPPVINRVSPGSVAEKAGLQHGDRVVSIDGQLTPTWQKMAAMIADSANKEINLSLLRDGNELTVVLTPEVIQEQGRKIGRLGISAPRDQSLNDLLFIKVKYGVGEAFIKAVDESFDKAIFSLKMMWKMVVGEVSWRNITGPVTIADYAGQSAKVGAIQYLNFMALISVSLAVLNLLPIPVLDGGHILYYLCEILKGKPLSERSMEFGQRIGLGLMLMLMCVAFFNDLNRLISPG